MRKTVLFLFTTVLTASASAEYEAAIYRDSFGVPHIVAKSIADAAFGDGYAQAEDRLELLMRNIQAATGTRAAVLGPKFVAQDYASRLTGARRFAYEAWDKLPAQVEAIFEGFASGVNRFIKDHPKGLTQNSRSVEPQEILALARYISLVRQFYQARKDSQGQGMTPISGEGSNGWVLAPSRTVSGKAILLCDPHTPWNGINRWYEKHYITPEVNIYGASTTGVPSFLFATTAKIAWTFTRNPGDRGDCFVISINPADREQYLLDGKPTDFARIAETIEVNGAKPVKRIVYETVHGPVLGRKGDKAFAAGMSLYTAKVGAEQLLRMALAHDVEEFKEALSLRQADGANAFCVDTKGNILYGWMNRLMIRNDDYVWTKPVDGSTSKTLYRGVLPFERMAQSINDPGGYYQASNGADWELERGAWGMKPADFPKWVLASGKRRCFSARPQRVVDLIRCRPRHTLEQVCEMALDTRAVAAEWAMPALERAAKELGDGGKPEVQKAMDILRKWVAEGPTATMKSRGYSIFRELCAQLGRGGLADTRNAFGLPDSCDALPSGVLKRMHSALLAAVESMMKLYGTVSVEWGKINVIELADGRQFPCGVGDATVQTVWQGTQDRRGEEGKWRVTGGSDFMMATEMSDPPVIYTLVPYGQSDNPTSPHFADQTERWTKGQWKRAWFTLEDVKRQAKTKKEVSP